MDTFYRYPVDPNFPQLWALNFDRTSGGTDPYGIPIPQEFIGNDSYLRVGDSAFSIPPTNIRVVDLTANKAQPIIRTKGGIVDANGYVERQVEIELIFSNAQEIFGMATLSTGTPVALTPSDRAIELGIKTGDDNPNKYLPSPPVSPHSLAALVSQFKRTPILPVTNNLLNLTYRVNALALKDMVVSTVRDDDGMPFPNVLRVILMAYAFETSAFCNEILDLDAAFIYPLQRWFWRQAYSTYLPGEWRTAVKKSDVPDSFKVGDTNDLSAEFFPIYEAQSLNNNDHVQGGYVFNHIYPCFEGKMSSGFQFFVISSEWLAQLEELRARYARAFALVTSDDFRYNVSSSAQQVARLGLQELYKELNELDDDGAARMDPWYFSDSLVLRDMSLSITNDFAIIRAPELELPAYQHMSQGNVRITATFHATNVAILNDLQRMIEVARKNSRDQRYELIAGFVGFENELASLMGVRNVVFTDISTANIEGFPDQYLITIEMISFDRHQRQIEKIKATQDLPFLFMDQLPSSPSPESGPKGSESDPRYRFWQRYIDQYDQNHDPHLPSGTGGDNGGFDTLGRPTNAWFNGAWIQEAKEQMAYLELYPDLSLPTYERLQYAIEAGEIFDTTAQLAEATAQGVLQDLRWQFWTDKGRFVDPDFYVDYPNLALATTLGLDLSSSAPLNRSVLGQYQAGLADGTNYTEPAVALAITGSISEALYQSLFDDHGVGTFLGPDIGQLATNNRIEDSGQSTVPTQAPPPPDGSDPSNSDSVTLSPSPNNYVPPAAGDTGMPRGSKVCHGYVGCPSYTQATNPFDAQIMHAWGPGPWDSTINIDGTSYKYSIPDENPGMIRTSYPERKDWSNIKGASDAFKDSADEVAGNKNEPGKDNRPYGNDPILSHHPIDHGSTYSDQHGRLLGHCYDSIQYDVSGRLVQAYPTYVLQLLDEGPRLSWAQLFPTFFALQSVQSISIIRDRRDPAHTATLTLMNSYGNLNSYTQMQLTQQVYAGLTQGGRPIGEVIHDISLAPQAVLDTLLQKQTSAARDSISSWLQGLMTPIRLLLGDASLIQDAATLRQQMTGRVMLAPGVRVHIRLGYGSNGANMPVAFNGRITDVAMGELVEITAMGDGLELAKLIPGAESQTNTINAASRGFLAGVGELVKQTGSNIVKGFTHVGDARQPDFSLMADTYEPREIICLMLSSHGEDIFDYSLGTQFWNMVKSNIYKGTNGSYFADNHIGICHFGNPYLMALWDGIGQIGQGPGTWDPAGYAPGPKSLDAFKTVRPLINEKQSVAHNLLRSSMQGINPFVGALHTQSEATSASLQAYVLAGSAIDTVAGFFNNLNQTHPTVLTDLLVRVGGAAADIVTSNATLFTQGIACGFGETGENVYCIYEPLTKFGREVGSYFSHNGLSTLPLYYGAQGAIQNVASDTVNKAAGIIGGDSYTEFLNTNFDVPTLPDTTQVAMGQPHSPTVKFNMFLNNKTAWDIISTIAQYFPPYIAAVEPFEYRSTLFFGQPHWLYRYDYNRLTAWDLGQVGDGSYDKFYGYPAEYKAKPFCQFHYYGSKLNLLSNDIRATDEETYTDVELMWYTGQGYGGARSTPMAQHMTVDPQIAGAYRKTAIVNTDVVGVDTPPAASSVLLSGGLDWLYWFLSRNAGLDFGHFSLEGWMNNIFTLTNIRQMGKAVLRDYQKLMYQGEMVVIGDPTVKPYDLIYLDDNYNDLKGACLARRVIHHFGYETGFVTSIEPDLLAEVTEVGQWISTWAWLAGFVAVDLSTYLGANFVLAQASKRGLAAMVDGFGIKATGGFLQQLSQKVISLRSKFGPATKIESEVSSKAMSLWERRALAYKLREMLYSAGNDLFLKKGIGDKFLGLDQGAYKDLFTNFDKFFSTMGKGTKTSAAAKYAAAEIQNATAEFIERDGLNLTYKGIAKSAAGGLVGEKIVAEEGAEAVDVISLDGKAGQIVFAYTMKTALLRWMNKGIGVLGSRAFGGAYADVIDAFSILGKTAFKPSSFTATEAQIGEAIVAEEVAEEGVALTVGAAALKAVQALMRATVIGRLSNPIGWIFTLVTASLSTAFSRSIEDKHASLAISFLRYRGNEFQAGLTGHSEELVLQSLLPDNVPLKMDKAIYDELIRLGLWAVKEEHIPVIKLNGDQGVDSDLTGLVARENAPTGQFISPEEALLKGIGPPAKYDKNARQQIMDTNGLVTSNWENTASIMTQELLTIDNSGIAPTGGTADGIFDVIRLCSANNLRISTNAVARYSHANTDDSNAGYHWNGLAVDIGGFGEGPTGTIQDVKTPGGAQLAARFLALVLKFPEFFNWIGVGAGLDSSLFQMMGIVDRNGSSTMNGHIYVFRDGPGHIHFNVPPPKKVP